MVFETEISYDRASLSEGTSQCFLFCLFHFIEQTKTKKQPTCQARYWVTARSLKNPAVAIQAFFFVHQMPQTFSHFKICALFLFLSFAWLASHHPSGVSLSDTSSEKPSLTTPPK